ncbi:hypothetical protein ACP4OV_025397 [Aristida adscensionis]
MYGSPVAKDLNLPAAPPPPQQQMSSPGLLRYRSAPSTLLGEVMCGDHHGFAAAAGDGGGGGVHRADHGAAADTALARFLAGHHHHHHHHHPEIRDTKPPRPAAAAHFLDATAAASMASQHQHQQQELMYHSQQQQQQMAAMEGLYRTLSSGGTEPAAAAAAANNSLLRQSSSPAGFLDHLTMDNGYGGLLRAGIGGGAGAGAGDARLKGQLSYSSRQGSVMSQISEMGSDELGGGGGSSPEAGTGSDGAAAARGGYGGVPGYPMGGAGGWDDASPTSGASAKRPRDAGADAPAPDGRHLAPQLSLPSANGKPPAPPPSASPEMAAIEKFLQFQDAVPCKIRAKRGCATHPRSIAERVRRTRISERIRKLQELVPNMEKQTNTADMLDLAADYIKDLQKQVKVLNDGRAHCTCAAGKLRNQFTS